MLLEEKVTLSLILQKTVAPHADKQLVGMQNLSLVIMSSCMIWASVETTWKIEEAITNQVRFQSLCISSSDFIDDLNLPEVDTYNTQSAIAHLRQPMEYEHC